MNIKFAPILLSLFGMQSVSSATVEYYLEINGDYLEMTNSSGADISRSASLINGTLPGPTLVAEEGDQVIIRVKNLQGAGSSEATLHWHGMFQSGTPYMDGVQGVSQCGICVGCEEVYNFTASPAGTHWYHSHSGTQYANGQYGALIVNPSSDADIPDWEANIEDEYIVMMHEWSDATPLAEYQELAYAEADLGGTYDSIMEADVAWPTILVNGAETTEYNIESGKDYRFRFMSAAANYAFNVSVASHQMQLVMVDPGTYLDPSMVDYLSVEIGARYDVVINSDAAPGKYPIYIADYSGLNVATSAYVVVDDGTEVFDEGAASADEITNTVSYPVPLENTVPSSANSSMTISLGGTDSPYSWNMNGTAAVLPSVPVFLSGGEYGFEGSSITDTVTVASVDVNEVVDIELDNDTMMTHPFHLHGHQFWVLGMTTSKDEELVQVSDPQARDTVNVPAMGKVLIRVQFNNPGPWIFHCHIDLHLVAGMAMVFLVGDAQQDWPVPDQQMRLCGGTDDFVEMFSNPWSLSLIGTESASSDE